MRSQMQKPSLPRFVSRWGYVVSIIQWPHDRFRSKVCIFFYGRSPTYINNKDRVLLKVLLFFSKSAQLESRAKLIFDWFWSSGYKLLITSFCWSSVYWSWLHLDWAMVIIVTKQDQLFSSFFFFFLSFGLLLWLSLSNRSL